MTVDLDELGIGAPLVDRKNEVMRTMSDSEVRKAGCGKGSRFFLKKIIILRINHF